MTRAGEYLLRGGMTNAAAIAARDASARARSLLPACALGVKCALKKQDRKWALQCTRDAVSSSVTPSLLFCEKLVQLKSDWNSMETDAEMVEALKVLEREDPKNPLWSQMLGYARFQRGGWEVVDSIYQMTAAVEGGATNKIPYMIAAEASRLLGNTDRAADLLRRGLKYHPGNLSMLNNLVYTLSETTNGLAEAVELLPDLIKKAGNDPGILDTIAVVHLRSGQYERADRILRAILRNVTAGTREWFRAKTLIADAAIRRGKYEEAEAILREALKSTRAVPNDDVLVANRLLIVAMEKREDGRLPIEPPSPRGYGVPGPPPSSPAAKPEARPASSGVRGQKLVPPQTGPEAQSQAP